MVVACRYVKFQESPPGFATRTASLGRSTYEANDGVVYEVGLTQLN